MFGIGGPEFVFIFVLAGAFYLAVLAIPILLSKILYELRRINGDKE